MKKETRDMLKVISCGTNNSNSKYSDEELIQSYIECCKHFGQIVSLNLWVMYSKVNNKPYLRHIKKFRFNGNGIKDLIEYAKLELGYKTSNTKRLFYTKDYRNLVKEYKKNVYQN